MFLNVLFLLSAAACVLGAIGVMFSKNLIHACVFLLCALFGVAGLYATLNADFLAAVQLVVYAGGVVILMIFGMMLTGGGGNRFNKFGLEKVPSMGNVKTYTVGGITVVVVALTLWKLIGASVSLGSTVTELPAFKSTVKELGVLLITDHVLAFEISSILLLGALVGAAVIARPRKNI